MQALAINMRELIRVYGRGHGLALSTVALYGRQLCSALEHLAATGIVHADLKPDNIVVSEGRMTCKVRGHGALACVVLACLHLPLTTCIVCFCSVPSIRTDL